MASSRVFSLIFPPAEASRSCLEWGHKPSMKMLSWTGSLNPFVGVFQSNPWKRSSASLNDSSGCLWKDEISTLPSTVLDSGKHFFRNFSTTSSHVRRLFPLNEWSHLFASLAKEKRINWGGWRLLALLLSSLCYRSQYMRLDVRTDLHLVGREIDSPGSAGWGNVDRRCWPLSHLVWLCWWSIAV